MECICGVYIDEVDDWELLESVICGMFYELDFYFSYLILDQFDDLQVIIIGEFGGLGIEVIMEDGFVKVVILVDGFLVSKAGIQVGDLILKIDEMFVKGLTLGEVVELMRGEVGLEIELMVFSEGDEKSHQVIFTCDKIQLYSVKLCMLELGMGYLWIFQFQNNIGDDVCKALDKLVKEDILCGLVLDLCNNFGGVLGGVVEVVDLFMDSGLIVYTQGCEQSS